MNKKYYLQPYKPLAGVAIFGLIAGFAILQEFFDFYFFPVFILVISGGYLTKLFTKFYKKVYIEVTERSVIFTDETKNEKREIPNTQSELQFGRCKAKESVKFRSLGEDGLVISSYKPATNHFGEESFKKPNYFVTGTQWVEFRNQLKGSAGAVKKLDPEERNDMIRKVILLFVIFSLVLGVSFFAFAIYLISK